MKKTKKRPVKRTIKKNSKTAETLKITWPTDLDNKVEKPHYDDVQALFNSVSELQNKLELLESDREVWKSDRTRLQLAESEAREWKQDYNNIAKELKSFLNQEQFEAAVISHLKPELYALEWIRCSINGKIGYTIYNHASLDKPLLYQG